MSTEAQKRASKKYYLKHREYYSKKSADDVKTIRKRYKEYKYNINKTQEYINKIQNNIINDDAKYDILAILVTIKTLLEE